MINMVLGAWSIVSAGWKWLISTPWARWMAVGFAAAVALFIEKNRIEGGIRKGIQKEADLKARLNRAESAAATQKKIQENSDELVRESERVRVRDVAVELPDGQGAALPDAHYRD